MLFLTSLAALVLAQFLPGLLVVKLLDIGRDREERFVFAAVLAGPVAALVYLLVLLSDWEPLYWTSMVNLAVAALIVPYRTKLGSQWSRATKLTLAAILLGVVVPYLLTTGSLYRPGADGDLQFDRALQRDVLFHIGIIRSLEHDYPPALLSVSATPVGYHVGYHLQLAAWARYFGIDAFDGLIRVATLWQLTLLVLSGFVLARRFTDHEPATRLAPLLTLCAGLGFLFFYRPSVDWWSLVFMDVTLVSVFLANPLLPAIPVLFVALALLDDFVQASGRGAVIGAVVCTAFLLVLKMFVGAQLLAAMGTATLVRFRDARLRAATIAASVASLPFLAQTFLAAEGSNTSVSVRPLEVVRYAMEKLDWTSAIEALASAGRFEGSAAAWAMALAATLVWTIGFLGLRLVALPRWLRDLGPGASSLHRTMAWFVAIGFPVALVFRIAPAESQGLSRLEAQNDVLWFAASSGLLLWFWVADTLKGRAAMVAVLLVALPSTVQHFVFASRLEPDRIAIGRALTAETAAVMSPPDSIWLDPLDRSRPSLLPYLAGRAVVYDPYVGYDYMFVGRDEIERRRHAVAQFWTSGDPAFRAWVLDHYDVDYVWQQGAEIGPLRGLEAMYTSTSIVLFRVHERAIDREALAGIRTPSRIPTGGAGARYFGTGFRRSERARVLAPGTATLYVPRPADRPLSVSLALEPRHGGGELIVGGVRSELRLGRTRLTVELPPRDRPGLDAIELEWRGERPLGITELRLAP